MQPSFLSQSLVFSFSPVIHINGDPIALRWTKKKKKKKKILDYSTYARTWET